MCTKHTFFFVSMLFFSSIYFGADSFLCIPIIAASLTIVPSLLFLRWLKKNTRKTNNFISIASLNKLPNDISRWKCAIVAAAVAC